METLNVPNSSLETFDMTIATAGKSSPEENMAATDAFCAALQVLPALGTIKTLVIRKAADAYLTLPGPASILECLSDAIERWDSLVSISATTHLTCVYDLTHRT